MTDSESVLPAEGTVAPALTVAQVMGAAPVIPVIVLDELAHAVPLARALLAGGIRMLEVTLRTPAALECIEAICREVPESVVGAGTIRSASDAQSAASAGARFAVSPGYTDAIAQACEDLRLPWLPGVATSSEIMRCLQAGFGGLKFFPAMPGGGAAMLKAWSGPFAEVRFCPTGGVTLQNAPELLDLPNVPCVGGSWLVPAEAMRSGDWGRVTRLAQQTVALRKPAG